VDYVESYAYQVGPTGILVGLAVLAAAVFGVWKVAKLLWAALSS
jgi:hypothetical protein